MITALALILATAVNGPQAVNAPQYEVYAIRYATIPGFPVAGLVAGAEKGPTIDIAMMVWLVRGGGRTILVDSGFYRPQFFKNWKVTDFVRPDEAVARAGVKPDEVTDVILTHAHWDHADGADLFPKARIWIQKDEYTYYTGSAWQPGGKHGGIDPDDVLMLTKMNLEGRMHLIDGDQEIFPGIRVYTGGRHTWASQYATVETRSGTVVLASDNMYLYENLDRHLPIAQTFDAQSNLRAQDRMKSLAAKPELIVPGHDPAVLTRFPKVTPNVVRID
ncbi:MAG TPA: N-acyl homoserine lactonase family protein [Thermoanaerobaculia bacterium]|jgi:glyoxylase-like metal-dependent hydrolase (beta-lactamase superfamily II)|nr:N-acyl homoserine lactonase family protein [Thermoanaerobaculia bacterium]